MANAAQEARTPARSPPRPSLARMLVAAGLAALTLAIVLSLAGSWWWVLDLFAHFHAIYLLAAGLAGLALAALRWWRLAVWAAILTTLAAVRVLPLYALALGEPSPSTTAPRLRVISYNMLHGNPHTAAAAQHIAGLAPDVVVLLEATPQQLQVFTTALPGWHAIAEPRDDAFGIAVLSRRAPSSARVVTPGPPWMPAIELQLSLGDHTVTIFAVHPPPPVSESHTRTRDELLRTLSAWAAARTGPVVVVGDLNATPWSSTLRELLRDGPLRSTQRFGLHATWPASLGVLGLPIDHVLVAGPLHPRYRSIEPAFGSDHRMLLVELVLR
jgi:endonuclease/exonuclease/phosphatase (EEP) superfamily protein YafD